MKGKKERRSYFRIDDVIGLSYEIVDEEQPVEAEETLSPDELLARQLREIDFELNRATNLVWQVSPAIANAIGILNKKMALLARHYSQQGAALPEHCEEYKANISGSGMSFRSTEALEIGTLLRVSAVLKPSNIEVNFIAEVVGCDKVQDMPTTLFLLRIRLLDDEFAAREQLVQHVVQKQSLLRSMRKQAAESLPQVPPADYA